MVRGKERGEKLRQFDRNLSGERNRTNLLSAPGYRADCVGSQPVIDGDCVRSETDTGLGADIVPVPCDTHGDCGKTEAGR